MNGFSFDPFREKRLAWQNMGPNPDVPQQDDSIQEFRRMQKEGLRKQGSMQEWLRKANEKFKEGSKEKPGYQGDYLKDIVSKALANGAIEADEIFKMKSEIVFRLENILSADEWQKLAKEFPTDQKGLLKLWSDAGLMSIDEMLEAKGTPQNQQNQKEWSLQSNASAGSSKSPEASESWENIQDLRDELEQVRLEGHKLTSEYASIRPVRGKGRNPDSNMDPSTVAERKNIAAERRGNSQRYNELNEQYKRHPDNPSRAPYGKYLMDNGLMTYRGGITQDQMQAKAEKMDDEYRIKQLEEQLAKQKQINTLRAWDTVRGSSTAMANQKWKENQWREEWAAEGIRPGASASDDRFREHMSRAGGSTDGISGYIDSTGKDKDPSIMEDPNFVRLGNAFERAMKQWEKNPGRQYGDLAIMRSQLQYMQKRGKFNQLMKGVREKITAGSIQSLHKESIGSPGGRYFSPGEKVRITIPAELLPYSEGKDLTVVYEPFTVIDTEEDSQMQALMDAGIIIDKQEAIAGTYPDGRPRIRGIDVHFTRQGRYVINGSPITIGEKGKEVKKEQLKGPSLGSYPLSFHSNQAGVINITDGNGETFTFDVRRMKPSTTIVDVKGDYSVTRQKGGQYLVEIAEKGSFSIEGFEGQSGQRIYSRLVSTEGHQVNVQPLSVSRPIILPSFLLQNPASPIPLSQAASQIDAIPISEFLEILAQKYFLTNGIKEDKELMQNLSLVRLERIPSEIMGEIIQSDTVQTTKHFRQLIQYKAMIARNLAFRNITVTPEEIQNECTNILEARNTLRDIPLFRGRNVLYTANNEKLKDIYSHGDSDRFGKKANRDAITEQQKNGGGSLTFIRAKETSKDAAENKKDILGSLVSKQPPLTLYFEGHGLPNSLQLTESGDVEITATELAGALKKRYENHPSLRNADPRNSDIIILGCCHNADFARNVKSLLGNDVSGPIFITESEYGLPGYSNFENKYTDRFSETTLGLGSGNAENPSTIGTIFDHEFDENMETNPSIYLPYQIGQNGRVGWGQMTGTHPTSTNPVV